MLIITPTPTIVYLPFQETVVPVKKGSLDALSHDELVAKCKSLVGTLLKAKQEKQGKC